jgi:nucleotide-binding universal stress UspA family protein
MSPSMRSKRWAGFRSLLCPIDFSETSRLALRYAATIAVRGHAVLRVAYVNDPLLIAAAAAALRDRHLAERSARELQTFIDATLSTHVQTSLDLKLHVAIGDAAAEIEAAAARGRSDLIVLGSHGLTGADRLLVGSTTLRLLQRSAIPVLAVPRAGEHLVTSPSASWPGERIVAALELDGSTAQEVDVAAHIAQWLGSSLLLIHVVSAVAAPAWFQADLSAHDRILVARAQRRLEALTRRGQKHVTTQARVVWGRVADEVAAVAAAERTGLLITALRDRRGWFGAKRGSISYHVLTHATAPVLAYPPQWRPR